MQGGLTRGTLSFRKCGFVRCFVVFFMLNGFAQAGQSNDDAQREQLIELSLKNSRNPQYLDSLARELLSYQDKECKARGYFLKGLGATYKGNIDSALYNYQQSLSFIPAGAQYDKRFTYYMVMKNVGIAHYRKKHFQEGDSIFNSMAAVALDKGDSLTYSLALINLGNALSLRRDFNGAIGKYREAILIEENLGSQGVASTYLKIGTVFGRMSQEEEALLWFKKAQLRIPERDLQLKGRVNNNIAVAWRNLGNLDSAQYYLNKALTIHQTTGSLIDQAMALENLARNEITLGDYLAADHFLKEAYELLPEGTKLKNYSLSRLWILSLELALARNETTKAESFIQSLESAQVQIQSELDYLRLKARYFEQVGAKDSAIYYLKVLQAKEQALNKQNDAAKIKQEANAVELAEIRRKEKEAQEKSIFRYWLLAFFLIFLALIVFYFIRRLKRKTDLSPVEKQDAEFTEASVKNEYAPLKVQKEAESQESKSAVLQLKSKAVIKVDEVLYIQSEGHYVNIYLQDQENPEVERTSLSTLLNELGEDSFQRIHRSYAVNMRHLKAAYSNRVLLKSGQELPVTRTYNAALKERFNKKDS